MRRALAHLRRHLPWYFLLFLLAVIILLAFVVFREDRDGKLTFVALSVGQGDALFIESPTGTQVLVDGGPGNVLSREISAVMPWYDRHIDALIITNADRDHYEGFISLLDRYKVDVVVESSYRSDTPAYASLQKKIVEKGIPRVIVRTGEIIDLGGGARMNILFPDRDVSGVASNDASIVARLVYGDTSVLLQGDSPTKIEDYLLYLFGDRLKSTILKAGHHGSRTSSSEEYVKAVSPEYAVISAGKNSEYGHPHREVLEALAKYKVQVLATCAMGRVIFQSDGKSFTLKSETLPVAAGCK